MKGQDVPPERPPCPKAVVLIRERYEPSPHEIRRDQRVDLMNARTLAVVLSLSLAAPALADDGHRELGAHVHGHGTLNIAVETTRVELELEAPGMDIVGFEHEAKTAEHKAAIEAAKAKLKDPLSFFRCRTLRPARWRMRKSRSKPGRESMTTRTLTAMMTTATSMITVRTDRTRHST